LYIAKISTHITPALNKSSIEDEEESKLLNKKQIMERRLIEEEQEKFKKNSNNETATKVAVPLFASSSSFIDELF